MKKKADTPPVVPPPNAVSGCLDALPYPVLPPYAQEARDHLIAKRQTMIDAAITCHKMETSVLRAYADEIATLKVLIDAINEPR